MLTIFYTALGILIFFFSWNYQSVEQLEGRDFLGRRTTYGGGGYTQLLEESRAGSEKIISELKVIFLLLNYFF